LDGESRNWTAHLNPASILGEQEKNRCEQLLNGCRLQKKGLLSCLNFFSWSAAGSRLIPIRKPGYNRFRYDFAHKKYQKWPMATIFNRYVAVV
jgi:hypothetical protein